MYAEIRRHQVDLGSVDEAIRGVREVFLPVISRIPGVSVQLPRQETQRRAGPVSCDAVYPRHG